MVPGFCFHLVRKKTEKCKVKHMCFYLFFAVILSVLKINQQSSLTLHKQKLCHLGKSFDDDRDNFLSKKKKRKVYPLCGPE